MIIECPNCGFKGNIDETKIPEKGARLTCNKCQEKFSVNRPSPVAAISPEPEFIEASAVTDQPSVSSVPTWAPMQDEPVRPTENPQWTCSVCGEKFMRHELARFGENLVCGNCKPTYVQMLQQGVEQTAYMRYAGFWVRFAAKFIDAIILWILLIPISMIFSNFNFNDPEAVSSAMASIGIMYIFQILIPAAFTCFFLGKFQATPGKMALGLVVVSPEQGQISYPRALGRHFAEWISWMILGIGYLMAAFDDEKRSLHDRICSTRVAYK